MNTMYLSNLKLSNFKCYTEADVSFCPNVNCLLGDNGVGKTNLLDAVYYLSFGKSFFSPTDLQHIRLDGDFFAIHGTYNLNEEEVLVSCILKRGQPKQLRWNRKPYRSLGEHVGKLPLVMVAPNDQVIITGGSELRRKFVDGVISQTDRGYLQHLLQYSKALEQRNKLLKQMYEDRVWDESSVVLWDEQLALHGKALYEGREAFVREFSPLFDFYFSWLTGGKERCVIKLDTCSAVPLQQQLMEARNQDRFAQYTTVGPHKDDLELLIGLSGSSEGAETNERNALSVKRYGSQGQQKTFALALKLAQFEYIYQRSGVKPILLLDDIFDKLDLSRVKQLVQLVGGDRFGQVFLTDTQPGRVEGIFAEIPQVEHRIIKIESMAGQPRIRE